MWKLLYLYWHNAQTKESFVVQVYKSPKKKKIMFEINK